MMNDVNYNQRGVMGGTNPMETPPYTSSTTQYHMRTTPQGMPSYEQDYVDSPIPISTPINNGLRPRIDVCSMMRNKRPFWDFQQDSIDKSAIQWQPSTSVDGRLTGLYIQAPYGYYNDLLTSSQSTILNWIADMMEADGHKDWADTVRADGSADVEWSSGACQSFGFSYSKDMPLDKTLLEGLASWQPYQVNVLHPELMSQLADDEKVTYTDEKTTDGTLMLGGGVFSVFSLIGSLMAIPQWPLAIGLGVMGALWLGVTIGAYHRKKKAEATPLESGLGDRPGYVLKTTSGWVVMLLDSSTHATPRQRTAKAAEELSIMLDSTRDPDRNATIVKTYTSDDGLMTFFQSDRPLTAECELSPYKAEQYLSLYAKHCNQKLRERNYTGNGPMVIKGTMGLPAVHHEMEEGAYGRTHMSTRKSRWSPEGAMEQAVLRLKNTMNNVNFAHEDTNIHDNSAPILIPSEPVEDTVRVAHYKEALSRRLLGLVGMLQHLEASGYKIPQDAVQDIVAQVRKLNKAVSSVDDRYVEEYGVGNTMKAMEAVERGIVSIEAKADTIKLNAMEARDTDSVISTHREIPIPVPDDNGNGVVPLAG